MKNKKAGTIVWQGQTLPIYETTNYEMFKPESGKIPGNRKLKESHVDNLVTSMSEKLLFGLIKVNEKNEVLDGQHRLEAMSRIGLPVHYIVLEGYGIEDIKRYQIALRWNNIDILEQYCEMGVKDYLLFKEFYDSYRFEILTCHALLSNNYTRSISNGFKNGYFKVTDYDNAILYAERINEIFAITRYKGVYSYAWTAAFVKVFKAKKYNHDRFMIALENYARFQKDSQDVYNLAYICEQWYNKNLPSKNRIKVLSAEEMEKVFSKLAA